MKRIVLIILLFGLCGCAKSTDQLFKARCGSYGYIPGTGAYEGCVDRQPATFPGKY